MTSPIDDILAQCAVMVEDHDPEGWPSVRMGTITALCDAIRSLSNENDALLTILRELGTYSVQGAIISAELNGRITKPEAAAVRSMMSEG